VTPYIALPDWPAPTFERTYHYHESLRRAGGEPLVVAGPELPEEASGLLLTGGVDVNAERYGERPHEETQPPNDDRDEQELGLVAQALERGVPVLGVCRGSQLLNVAFGGSLLQHIQGDGHRADGEVSKWHMVFVDGEGGILAGVYGNGRELRVNSRHHQAITPDRLSPELIASALSPDGFVEAFQSAGHPWVLGVQWHPERPEMSPAADALFEAFVAACRT
jgi:putative glutamine amidotransferase